MAHTNSTRFFLRGPVQCSHIKQVLLTLKKEWILSCQEHSDHTRCEPTAAGPHLGLGLCHKMTAGDKATWCPGKCPRQAPRDQSSRTDGPRTAGVELCISYSPAHGLSFSVIRMKVLDWTSWFNFFKQQKRFLKMKSPADLQCTKRDKNGTTLTEGTLPHRHLGTICSAFSSLE